MTDISKAVDEVCGVREEKHLHLRSRNSTQAKMTTSTRDDDDDVKDDDDADDDDVNKGIDIDDNNDRRATSKTTSKFFPLIFNFEKCSGDSIAPPL